MYVLFRTYKNMHHTHFLQNNSVLLELSLNQIEYIVRHQRCCQLHDTIHYKVSKHEHIQLLYDKKKKKNFLWLSLGRNQYRREGLWFVCLLYDGSTRRLTESGFMWFYGFMEKPGIEPATPGLQGIALIHYTTGASLISWQWRQIMIW